MIRNVLTFALFTAFGVACGVVFFVLALLLAGAGESFRAMGF